MKLSVVISAYNEEKNILECLRSLDGLGAEIVVVDNLSSDRTIEIARKFTDKIFTQKNNPSKIDVQKNFGFSKASGEWILSLDADERLTEELKNEIVNTIRNSAIDTAGFEIPRMNIIFGKWIKHSGWYPDYQLRLFRKNSGKFLHDKVHEPVRVDGKIAKLSNHIRHENYKTINQFLNRLIIYTDSEADAMLKNDYKFDFADCLKMPTNEFLRRFFSQEGYRDGIHGLVLSLLMSFYHFAIFLKLWEANKFKEKDNSLELFTKEAQKSTKEIGYWVNYSRAKSEKNPIKKIVYKTRQKISK